MNGIPNVQQKAERPTQRKQQEQRYMKYSLREIRPRYLQRRAQEHLMEYPNATRNEFPTHIIQ